MRDEGEREGQGNGRDDPPTYLAKLAALKMLLSNTVNHH